MQPQFPMKHLDEGAVFQFGTNPRNLRWWVFSTEDRKGFRSGWKPYAVLCQSENGTWQRFRCNRNVTLDQAGIKAYEWPPK